MVLLILLGLAAWTLVSVPVAMVVGCALRAGQDAQPGLSLFDLAA